MALFVPGQALKLTVAYTEKAVYIFGSDLLSHRASLLKDASFSSYLIKNEATFTLPWASRVQVATFL